MRGISAATARRRYVSRVSGFAALMALLALAGVALAQGVPKLHDVDPRLKAFDADEVGYEGVAADPEAVALAFDPLDYLIELEEELIKDTEAHVAELRARSAPAQDIAAAQRSIADARRRIDTFKARKQARISDPQCQMGAKIREWQDLMNFLDTSIQAMQTAYDQVQAMGPMPRMPSLGAAGVAMVEDPMEGLRLKLVRDKAVREVAVSQFAILLSACEEARQDANYKKYVENLDEANHKADAAGKEAGRIAEAGNFADLDKLREKVIVIVETARANQLMGNDEIGMKQQKAAIGVLQTFAQKAKDNCNKESFDPIKASTVERELELAAVPIDLRDCLPRMYEATGLAGGLPFRMRHCGTSFTGSWEMQATTNIMTLTGNAEVAGYSGTVSASGIVHDPSSRPYQMSLAGTVDFRIEETKDKHGLVTGR